MRNNRSQEFALKLAKIGAIAGVITFVALTIAFPPTAIAAGGAHIALSALQLGALAVAEGVVGGAICAFAGAVAGWTAGLFFKPKSSQPACEPAQPGKCGLSAEKNRAPEIVHEQDMEPTSTRFQDGVASARANQANPQQARA